MNTFQATLIMIYWYQVQFLSKIRFIYRNSYKLISEILANVLLLLIIINTYYVSCYLKTQITTQTKDVSFQKQKRISSFCCPLLWDTVCSLKVFEYRYFPDRDWQETNGLTPQVVHFFIILKTRHDLLYCLVQQHLLEHLANQLPVRQLIRIIGTTQQCRLGSDRPSVCR